MSTTVNPVAYAGYVYGQPNTSIRVGIADADYIVAADDTLIGITALTASRTITLPSAASAGLGKEIIVKDESGSCSPSTFIRVAGVIDNANNYTIITAFGAIRLYSNGSSWSKGGAL